MCGRLRSAEEPSINALPSIKSTRVSISYSTPNSKAAKRKRQESHPVVAMSGGVRALLSATGLLSNLAYWKRGLSVPLNTEIQGPFRLDLALCNTNSANTLPGEELSRPYERISLHYFLDH